ncbi:hypothetical protein CY34DRAFT_814033 [Suillus luteus UH-Slu-Lm8-n1]|uniref:Fungal-type protein kinase domain-containing protein n=1 Tax=Suillus luteus UH-Slu-Lm8-n1 TaxID=930992 RepID=A0A0D0A3Q1_9AGAM|nr:hypothetical protein CY34DRAFT_814033 [Suillus luteus UH-Slu-Lm8-n1]
MASNAGASARVPETPVRNSGLPTELKATPHAVGTAIISENISTLGVQVDDLREWITRDIKNFKKCEADEMLQQLLEMCTDSSQSLPPSQKSALLGTSIEAVMKLCNDEDGVPRKFKQHLTEFCNVKSEKSSYPHFVQAANTALVELRKVCVAGIPDFKDDEETDIRFHVNDPSYIYQEHQGRKSGRKPDVVVVSRQTEEEHKKSTTDHDNLQWAQVRTTLEFKRSKSLPPLLPTYNKDYVVPTAQQYMDYMKETNAPAKATDLMPAAGAGQPSHNKANEPQNIPMLLRSSKRGSDHLAPNEPPNIKRPKQDEEEEGEEKGMKEPKKLNAIVQNGLYAAEMFAAHIARQHVISFIVNNDIIYLWWFDRQHTIQCAGINFILDLPRFMVLLFIMQRMGYKQWGLHPLFEPEPEYTGEIIVEYEEDNGNLNKQGQDKRKSQKKHVDLTLNLKSPERKTHFGLRGRATTVFPVKSKALSALPRRPHSLNESTEFVAKLFWPEEARRSEPEILEEVYKIANEEDDVMGHVPDMVWFHKFEETSTAIIRKALGIDDTGSRVLYIIVFRKLDPITTLSGDEFLLAWWEVVKCHRALWKKGVHHRDVSPSNLMGYRLHGRFWSVLNDFDLSSIIQIMSSTKDAPRGLERTGTVPFMALDLLTPKAIMGDVEHVYRHDAESFIWVLTWICLRYDHGKLLRKNRPLDEWLTVDAIRCYEKKLAFLGRLLEMNPTPSHQKNFEVAKPCLAVIFTYTNPFVAFPADEEAVFDLWLKSHVLKSDVLKDVTVDNSLSGQ